MKSFELPITVVAGDIDDLGHVNNVVYLRWMQQAASAHWEAAADPVLRSSVHWVVIRHEIDFVSGDPSFQAGSTLRNA